MYLIIIEHVESLLKTCSGFVKSSDKDGWRSNKINIDLVWQSMRSMICILASYIFQHINLFNNFATVVDFPLPGSSMLFLFIVLNLIFIEKRVLPRQNHNLLTI